MVNAEETATKTKKQNNLNQQDVTGKIAEDYLTAHPEKIGEAVAIYLAAHPEFLLAAQENLRQRQEQTQLQNMQQKGLLHQGALLSTASPSVGPADASTAVIMFFDYQCPHCTKMAPAINALIKANPTVRFVFKEWPVLASKWPASALAARVGERVWKDKGSAAYLKYHDALFATGHTEGQLTNDDIYKAASPYPDMKSLKALERPSAETPETAALMKTSQLAQQLGLGGTPAFIVMPQSPTPDLHLISVFPGEATEDMLQAAILKAAGN